MAAVGARGGASSVTIGIFLSYLCVAGLQNWPLPLHLATHLTGDPRGDTAVYVWNTWVFSHELLVNHRWPFSTLSLLTLDGPADLSLHNYTVFADLLALPLQPWLGVIATFNVVFLINVALAGLGMFLLARQITGRLAESWIAGLLFASAPYLVTRAAGHFSLAQAAPLAFFVYWFNRAWATKSLGAAAAAGATIAWAYYSDPYFGIYCIMIGALLTAGRLWPVGWRRVETSRAVRRTLDTLIVLLVGLIVVVHGLAGGVAIVAGRTLAMRSLYTPMLVLTALVIARVLAAVQPRIAARPERLEAPLVRAGLVMALAAAALLGPELYALALRLTTGRMVTAPVLWRSSAPGLDLLAFFVPNPNHPLAPGAFAAFLGRQAVPFVEGVASVSFVGLAVMIAAARLAAFRPNRTWLAITIAFALVALGPFAHVGGVNTFVPTPWTLLRYVPVLGETRVPSRFAVVVALGFAAMFAAALVALASRFQRRRRLLLTAVTALLAFEMLAVPRRLYPADMPAIYSAIANDPRPVRVLELPLGIHDGFGEIGRSTPASQFYQTLHGKPILGGYLSRVEQATKDIYRARPTVDALLDWSEGHSPSDDRIQAAFAGAAGLVSDQQIGYVTIETARVAPDLRTFAIAAFGLTPIATDRGLELYTVAEARDRVQ